MSESAVQPGRGASEPPPDESSRPGGCSGAGLSLQPQGGESSGGGYVVHTDIFDGPLDLLLFLVTRQQLDITAVSLARVAEEYWAYLKLLDALDLDVESAYLVVFACLLELKSRLLLPPEPEPPELDDFDLGDTAEHDLLERLKEYRRFKEASRALQEREREALQVFPRGTVDGEEGFDGSALDVSLPDLLEALRGLLEAHQKRSRKRGRLRLERISVSVPQRMQELLDFLEAGRVFPFHELFAGKASRSQVIVTFLAVLELARLSRIRVWQEERRGPIYVERGVEAAVGRPEESWRSSREGEEERP